MALLGCFYDSGTTAADRAFASPSVRVGWQQKRAVSNCAERCLAQLGHSYMYMALKNGDECACGDSYKLVSPAVGMCTSDIGVCEVEYGCGGVRVLSIYNLSAAYSPKTELPASERSYEGDPCTGDTLPVLVDTYVAPSERNLLLAEQELKTGCNENTTFLRCSMVSENGKYTLTLGEDGKFNIVDSGGNQVWANSDSSFYNSYGQGPYTLVMGNDNNLKVTGRYTWSWASSLVKVAWHPTQTRTHPRLYERAVRWALYACRWRSLPPTCPNDDSAASTAIGSPLDRILPHFSSHFRLCVCRRWRGRQARRARARGRQGQCSPIRVG